MMNQKMEVKVCQQCKSMFQSSLSVDLCPVCQSVMNRLFAKVKTYIREHKSADVAEVSEKCHVSSKQILKWIREERLYFDEKSQVALPCLECGSLINTGKYCEACKKRLHKKFSSVSMQIPIESDDCKIDRVVAVKKKDRLRFS